MASWQDYEDLMRQQAGQPVEQAVGNAAQVADAKLQALRKMSQNLNGAPAQPGASPVGSPSPQMQMPIPEVQPNAPTMSPQDAQARMQGMIAAPQAMANAAAKLRGQAALDQAQLDAFNKDEDHSGYQDVHPVARQFPKIQEKVQAKKPITSKDIRDSIAPGMHEVTPELEKQLGYSDEEEK